MPVQPIEEKAKPEAFFAGRLSAPMSDLLRELNERPRLAWESKHLSSVLDVDQAHVVMLREQSLLTQAQAEALLEQLESLDQAGTNCFAVEPGYGSIVLQIERILAERIGQDTAGRLSIARSRLDQGAAVRRIVDRNLLLQVAEELVNLHSSIIKIAGKHGETPMISYTHLQQAQAATFGHYLLAFKDRLEDCFQQLISVYDRLDRCPLGAVGLCGTDLPIDRQRTAALLGFTSVLDNSRLGRDGYYQIEMTFSLALVMTILNDLCSELHIYSSTEFGTIELHDSHCSTSSVFPQKKNPYALETVKGKAGEAQGWVMTALATFRNEGTHDHAARTVSLLGDAVQSTINSLRLTSEIVEKLTFHRDRSEELLRNTWVTANRLGNSLLVDHGLDYRTSHGVVARLVKRCLADGISKDEVTIGMLDEAATQAGSAKIHMSENELRSALDPSAFIRESKSFGGVASDQFHRLMRRGQEQINQDRDWIEQKRNYLQSAQNSLKEAIRCLKK